MITGPKLETEDYGNYSMLSHMARHGIRNEEDNMRGEERERGMTQKESPEEDSPRVSMFQ